MAPCCTFGPNLKFFEQADTWLPFIFIIIKPDLFRPQLHRILKAHLFLFLNDTGLNLKERTWAVHIHRLPQLYIINPINFLPILRSEEHTSELQSHEHM